MDFVLGFLLLVLLWQTSEEILFNKITYMQQGGYKMSVHAAHCCKVCGCKYRKNDCPVVRGTERAMYECGDCLKRMLTIEDDLNLLSDEQRLAVFSNYCLHCGIRVARCSCWNDE